MKSKLIISIFLLAASLLIPLNLTYIYCEYYAEADLLGRKHFSEADDDDFLSLCKENSRVLITPSQFAQGLAYSFREKIFHQSYFVLPSELTPSIPRC